MTRSSFVLLVLVLAVAVSARLQRQGAPGRPRQMESVPSGHGSMTSHRARQAAEAASAAAAASEDAESRKTAWETDEPGAQPHIAETSFPATDEAGVPSYRHSVHVNVGDVSDSETEEEASIVSDDEDDETAAEDESRLEEETAAEDELTLEEEAAVQALVSAIVANEESARMALDGAETGESSTDPGPEISGLKLVVPRSILTHSTEVFQHDSTTIPFSQTLKRYATSPAEAPMLKEKMRTANKPFQPKDLTVKHHFLGMVFLHTVCPSENFLACMDLNGFHQDCITTANSVCPTLRESGIASLSSDHWAKIAHLMMYATNLPSLIKKQTPFIFAGLSQKPLKKSTPPNDKNVLFGEMMMKAMCKSSTTDNVEETCANIDNPVCKAQSGMFLQQCMLTCMMYCPKMESDNFFVASMKYMLIPRTKYLTPQRKEEVYAEMKSFSSPDATAIPRLGGVSYYGYRSIVKRYNMLRVYAMLAETARLNVDIPPSPPPSRADWEEEGVIGDAARANGNVRLSLAPPPYPGDGRRNSLVWDDTADFPIDRHQRGEEPSAAAAAED